MATLNITYHCPKALKPRGNNPRTHSKRQVRQIAESIKEFGFNSPVLIDAEGTIIAGHGRVEAAKLLGMDKVPAVRLEDMTEAQIRAYVIADNRLAELAGWDRDLLAIELQDLCKVDLDFDVTITGFETPEIDILIGELHDAEDDDEADEIPEIDDSPPVTRPGDLWLIGKHRLICGDATDPDAYASLLDGERAQLIFTDPPYNVPIKGHVSGLGKVKHREFAMASGEMSESEFTRFLKTAFTNLAAVSIDGSIHFICMDWRHLGEIVAAAEGCYAELKNLCVWSKTNGGMGSLYRSQHELVFVFKNGSAQHINNVELGRFGRNRTNVWTYPGINTFRKDRDVELALHPTVKPVSLVADAIFDCSERDGIVLDAFAGSGTTLMAAEKTGRRGYAIELDPRYCDVIVRRLAASAALEAIDAATGKPFIEIERERAVEAAVDRPPYGEDGATKEGP